MNMVNRGCTMGIPLYPHEDGDNTMFHIFDITSSNQWTQQCYQHNIHDNISNPEFQ